MKYPLSHRILHWFMALLILVAIGIGIYMTKFLTHDSPNRMEVYDLHKSLGVMVLIFIVIRIVNRLKIQVPPLPQTMPKIEIVAAHLAHIALYLGMVAVPLSGYLMSSFYGFPVKMFGLLVPSLVGTHPEIGGICASLHGLFAYGLLTLVVLHVLAVVKHRFFDKAEHDVLKRMI